MYKLTGAAGCASDNDVPYFNTDTNNPDAPNHDGVYTYTATNRATMDITATKAFVGLDDADITGRTPTPVVALAQATSNSSSDADWTIVGVYNTAYAGSPITYTWEDQPRTTGTTSYYYKVVELAPGTSTSVVNSALSTVTVLGSTPTKFGDGYYYTTTYSQTGPTVAPATGDMNLGTITNKVVPGKIIINKYKSGGTSERLEATFTLYESDGTTVAKTAGNAKITVSTTRSAGGTLDLATINLAGISTWPAEYRLKETTAPASCQPQPGYLKILIQADGSFSATKMDGFGIGNLSNNNDSGVSIGSLFLDTSGSAYPTITINVGNPGLVSVSASKSFSPELASGEGTTVNLMLMRNKYNSTSTTYVADEDFNGNVVTLNGETDTGTHPAYYESA